MIADYLKETGWTPLWGKPHPVRPGTRLSVLDEKQGGVGICVLSKHTVAPTPRTHLGDELYDTGRWQSAAIRVNGTSTLIHIVSVYGFTKANEGGEAMEQNELFLTKVFTEAQSLGDIPVIVCGDFNTKIENSAVLTEVSSAGAWIDAAGVISSALGTEPEVSFVSYCAESRIDLAFLNPMAARLLNNAQVLEVPDHGIKLHRPLRVTLDFSCAREFAYTTPQIRGFPPAVYNMGADDMEQLGNEIVERYARSFYGAWETGDVDAV